MAISELTISVEQCKDSAVNRVDWDNLPFGRVFTDHMLLMEYADGHWQDGVPVQDVPFADDATAVDKL